jgi:hypothetical protein
MTCARRPSTVIALALAAGALAVAFSAIAPPAPAGVHAAAANSATLQDSVAEEDARAPDISTVVVSNDDAGLLSFEIHFANRVALGPGEELSLWFDTDRNPKTGLLGSDRFIELIGGAVTLTNAETYEEEAAPSLTATAGASAVTIRIRANELGTKAAFDFFIWADATPDDEDVTDVDTAPDAFWVGWTYEVKVPPPPPVLALSAIVCTPKPVRSGKPMTAKARVSISRGDVPEALASAATVTWTAAVGSARLKTRSTAVFTDGVLSATWLLPKSAKGKPVRLSVSVTQEGVTTVKRQACRAA